MYERTYCELLGENAKVKANRMAQDEAPEPQLVINLLCGIRVSSCEFVVSNPENPGAKRTFFQKHARIF